MSGRTKQPVQHIEGDLSLYEHDDGSWSVSECRTWVEGAFASKEAARYATGMCPSKLSEIWTRHCPVPMTLAGLMTFDTGVCVWG